MLNYKKMIEDIVGILDIDFLFDMDVKTMPKGEPYTQEEAKRMAEMLGKVYKVAHSIGCKACQSDYAVKMFDLVDYKGKFTIIQDKDYANDGLDLIVGEITKEQAIADAKWRNEDAEYYGIPAYIGEDKELRKVYE